ncbi:RDD family protein [Halioxenophilus aromaticivorans]|uniref:RDD domain-containing protein n=1 Tax=Halioxenophilus aromaticivorans TaxID=1306992 RepID=A0AAV3U5F5_9ALTE
MEANIYKTPEAELAQQVKTEETDLASRGNRFIAALFDSLIIFPFTVLLMRYTGVFEAMSSGKEPALKSTLILTLASIAIFLAINGWLLFRDGQTLGKKLFRVKIVTLAGSKASVADLAKRYGFSWAIGYLPVIGVIASLVNVLFIFGKERRCLHDFVAGTKVIAVKKQKHSPEENKQSK